ncbi:MAG: hypothetical protein IT479_07310 [Xanthomonadales bacterium]|nr:hypothetical protein [Xanthomonadales bacterium]MCC6593071.1 hypothetical protein [Xanthomonadales bacterium]
MALRWSGLLLLAHIACVAAAQAQSVQYLDLRLPPPTAGDGAAGDNLGNALAIDGDLAVVAAFGDTVVAPGATFGISQGSVTVFERVGGDWLARQKLTPVPAGDNGDNFGLSVALRSGTLAIGAPRTWMGEAPEVGSVHIYSLTAQGGVLQEVLLPVVADPDQRFGTAVALWQDWLAVGAARAQGGRVDLFQRNQAGSYEYRQSLAPPPTSGEARFGTALALEGAELLIGAPAMDVGGAVFRSGLVGAQWTPPTRLPLLAQAQSGLGAAVVQHAGLALVGAPMAGAGEVRVLAHQLGGWAQVGTLAPSGLAAGDRFGSALALDGARAAVAASDALANEGRVHVYARSGQTLAEQQRLDRVDGGLGDRFGSALALVDDGLLVGSDLDRIGPNSGQGAAYWYVVAGATLDFRARLDNGDGAMYDRYGTAVATDGEIALIGAYVEDTLAGADAGAAHWYRRVDGHWQYGGRIDAPDADVEDRFGIAVAVDADRMAIGAYWNVVDGNVDQGSVYVYRREGDGWVFEQELTDASGDPGDYFGFALALDGDTLAVGARGDSDLGLEQGAVHVYRRAGVVWQREARFDLAAGNSQAFFGASVALAAGRLLVGAPGATLANGPPASGAAFAYLREGGQWRALATLKSGQPQANAAFGFALDASADYWLIGAFQEQNARGAAYLFRAGDAALAAELRANQPQPGEGLAVAVALAGDRALLGASGFDRDGEFGIGRVLQFEARERDWKQNAELHARDGRGGDGFGRALAVGRGTLIVGAPGRGEQNPLEGMAYVGLIDGLFQDGFE